jgi:hypothetical protein
MIKNNADCEMLEPFNFDDSLNDLGAEQAFALGIEWQMFRERLKTGQPFSTLCLAINATRLAKMARCQQRLVEVRSTPWEAWSELRVGYLFQMRAVAGKNPSHR